MAVKKIKGTFCESIKQPKQNFARGSFRWLRKGSTWVLLACPRYDWSTKTKACKRMRAYAILRPRHGRCAPGSKRVVK